MNNKCNSCSKKCIQFEKEELELFNIDFPFEIDKNVCPTNSISYNDNKIKIDSKKCIGCGICMSRCPEGLIKLKDGVAINDPSYDMDSDKEIKELYNNISLKPMNSYSINLLSRNLLIECGIKTAITRTGDNNLRMDGIIQSNDELGVLEIEFGQDILSSPRNLLDDIAVVCSRYGFKKDNITALSICLSLPNNRTDYWNVIKDIKEVLGIEIKTISIGSLVYIMWNEKKIKLEELPYLDSVDNSLIEKIEKILDKKIEIDDINSIFKTKK